MHAADHACVEGEGDCVEEVVVLGEALLLAEGVGKLLVTAGETITIPTPALAATSVPLPSVVTVPTLSCADVPGAATETDTFAALLMRTAPIEVVTAEDRMSDVMTLLALSEGALATTSRPPPAWPQLIKTVPAPARELVPM